MFHQVLLRMVDIDQVSHIPERRGFESIATSWVEIHNTNPGKTCEGSLRSPLVQFGNNRGFDLSCTLRDQLEAGMFRQWSA